MTRMDEFAEELRQEEERSRIDAEAFERDGFYYDSIERSTLDGEWVEQELLDEVADICLKVIKELKPKYEGRALKDPLLLYDEYLATQVIENISDVVECYNNEYDKRKSEKMFGIHYFDDRIKTEAKNILKNNLACN